MKHLVILSGAGMSAESGISTFRDSGGLWEKYDVDHDTVLQRRQTIENASFSRLRQHIHRRIKKLPAYMAGRVDGTQYAESMEIPTRRFYPERWGVSFYQANKG
jgi:hypothetical protein